MTPLPALPDTARAARRLRSIIKRVRRLDNLVQSRAGKVAERRRGRVSARNAEICLPATSSEALPARRSNMKSRLARSSFWFWRRSSRYIVLGSTKASSILSRSFRHCPRPGSARSWRCAVRDPYDHRADRRDPADRHREENAIMMIDFALEAEREEGMTAAKQFIALR